MRTVSQIFADMLANKEEFKASGFLRQYGLRETNALQWFALKGIVSPEWMGLMQSLQNSATREDMGNALLLTLAVPTAWEHRQVYIEWLAQNLDAEWHKSHHPIHHAAFHGTWRAFNTLEALYKAKTQDNFDWNTSNTSGHTPLYLALTEMQPEALVEILKKGANPHHMVNNPKDPGKQISVLNLAFQNKSATLSTVKEVWTAAKTKAAIQQSLDDSAEDPSLSKKKNRKM